MAFLVDSYVEDEAPNAKGGVDKRTVLKLDRRLALSKWRSCRFLATRTLSPLAQKIATDLATVLERRI
jgi:glycyl-tRNA synthetase